MQVGSLSQNRNLLVGFLIFVEIIGAACYFFYYYRPTQLKLQELNTIVERKSREVREIEMTKRLLIEKRKEIEQLKADIARLERYFPEEVFIPRVLVLLENLAQATHLKIDSIKPGMQGVAKPGAAVAAASAPGVPRPAATPPPAAPGAVQPAAGTTAPGTAPAAGEEARPTAIKFDSAREYKTINVDFNVVGTFQNISNFMNELTTFPKLVVVDTLNLTPVSNMAGAGGNKQSGAEVGSSLDLTAKMPLTFYIQQSKQPDFTAPQQ